MEMMSRLRAVTHFHFLLVFLVSQGMFSSFALVYTSSTAHDHSMNINMGEDAYIRRHSPLIILSNISTTMETRDLSYPVCFERVIKGVGSTAGCTQPGMTDQAIDMHQVTQINGFWALNVTNFTSDMAVYWLVNGETNEKLAHSTILAIDCGIDNIPIKVERSRLTCTSCPIQNFDQVANIVLENNQGDIIVEYHRSPNGQFVKDDVSPTSYAHLTLLDNGNNWSLQFQSCKRQENVSVVFTRKDRTARKLKYALTVSDINPAIKAKTDEGGIIHLWCDGGDRGFQEPTFFRNGAEIKSGDGLSNVDGTVVINGVTNTTEGNYTCQIDTACGKMESYPYTISLQEGRCGCPAVERKSTITCDPQGTTKSYKDVITEPSGTTETDKETVREIADQSPLCGTSLTVALIVFLVISIFANMCMGVVIIRMSYRTLVKDKDMPPAPAHEMEHLDPTQEPSPLRT